MNLKEVSKNLSYECRDIYFGSNTFELGSLFTAVKELGRMGKANTQRIRSMSLSFTEPYWGTDGKLLSQLWLDRLLELMPRLDVLILEGVSSASPRDPEYDSEDSSTSNPIFRCGPFTHKEILYKAVRYITKQPTSLYNADVHVTVGNSPGHICICRHDFPPRLLLVGYEYKQITVKPRLYDLKIWLMKRHCTPREREILETLKELEEQPVIDVNSTDHEVIDQWQQEDSD